MMRRVCNVLFFVLMLSCIHNSITAQVAYHNFNTNSGLPSNETYCAYQDKQGYMWFGTDHGVVKYNGYTFETYTTADGLTDNTVFNIKADPEGNIWFLTYSGGICYYNGKSFLPHPNNDSIKAIMTEGSINSWEVLDSNVIWMANIPKGFYRIATSKVDRYTGTNSNELKDSTQVWVVNFKNGRYVYTMLRPIELPKIANNDVVSIDKYKLAWDYLHNVAVNFGLTKLDDKKVLIGMWQMAIILSNNKIECSYLKPREFKIIQQKKLSNGELWLSYNNTYPYIITADNSKIKVVDSITDIKSVSDIALDNQGNYWLTTLNKGIFMLPNRHIVQYKYPDLVGDKKTGYLASNNEYLYVSLPNNSLLRIDKQLHSDVEKDHKEPSAIQSIAFDKHGNVVTNLGPIFHRDTATPYPKFYFTKIANMGNDRYLAGGTGGFAVVDKNGMYYSSRDAGYTSRVLTVCRISTSEYLVGTSDGLFRFYTNNGYHAQPDTLYSGIRITSAKMLNDKIYAIATRGKGVYVYIAGHRYEINEDIGLISDLVEDIFIQNDSILWVGTYKGLSKINYKVIAGKLVTKVNSYSTDDGLISNQINAVLGFNGFIWVATNDGLCYFKPEVLSQNTEAVPFYITSVKVNGNSHSIDTLQLQYFQNSITIDFNALYYKAIEGVRYKYRLKGAENWSYTERNSIQYFGLPAGGYKFEIAANDKFGKYTSNFSTLNFNISPRVTDTIYFKIIVGVLLIIIVVVIVYLIFSNQQMRSRNIIQLLQAEFKALNYQINPHFIFNVLNSIQYYIIRKDSDKAVQFLNSFSLLIRRIVTNSRQPYISVLEEVECLRDYLNLEKLRLDNKFEYEINIDSEINIEEKVLLPMIIQPLVENSIWHGIVPAERFGKIVIDFYKKDGALICVVNDNGVGINNKAHIHKKEQNNLSMAMGNVNERLKIIAELNGSEWFINIEDKSDKQSKEEGTIVTVKFPMVKKDR